ncbi:MAG: alpha-N-acetylglucosaminidase [Mediterranea sp.]|jgi:alpha-N-acetylglucosaminidase|nr:alpha-N-acetylglucosaminidase [Mediterranea sp.]
MLKLLLSFSIYLMLLGSCTSSAQAPIDDLARRVAGAKADSLLFRLQQPTTPDADYFEIERQGDKVLITGNNAVSQATGLNWYLKYGVGDTKVRRETTKRERYYLNYCTFSYSMPFWDWKRWEQEIDWMAMHGVNMPLSITGIETVWYHLLKRVGYSEAEIGEFIAGPVYMAWWQMNNLEGWGGPNPESWYRRQAELEKKIVARMRELGIEPVFPGYAGMVPRNIGEKLGYNIADPGKWCGFNRPAFLSTDDPHFDEFAAIYYEELEKLYGKSRYYSLDPFHEGGNSQGVDLGEAGKKLMAAMKKANPDAVWVVQSWQENPRKAMIEPLNAGDLLVLDLYSEKVPRWGDPKFPQYRKEGYGKHEWLYCMLLNFGGNVGLHGRMNQLVDGYYDACSLPAGETLRGVGATPEGIGNNPMMYELLFELPWRAERFSPDDWLQSYLQGRYGGKLLPQVQEAWRALEHTVYNMPVDYPGQGTVESLLCARPGFHLKRTSTWGSSVLFYPADSTAKAARLMLEARSEYAGNNHFAYDLTDIVRQSNADRANVLLEQISQSYDRKDVKAFARQTEQFLTLILQQDSLLSTRPEFSVDTWLNEAASAGNTPQEKQLYVRNAAQLITVWGDSIAANQGGLHEYAHREWGGVLRTLYYDRWAAFFKQRLAVLEGKEKEKPLDFYAMEKAWVDRQVAAY